MAKKLGIWVIALLLAVCVASDIYLLFFDRPKEASLDAGSGGGSEWFIEEGTPSPDLGKTGDCFFDLETATLYQKTSDGWKNLGTLHQDPADSAEAELTITFDPQEGDLPNGKSVYTVKKGTFFALPVPVRDGYDFLGWFTAQNVNGGQATDLTVFTENITLYARWRKQNIIAVTLTDGEGDKKINDAVRFTGTYDGTLGTAIELLIECDGTCLNLSNAQEAGWIQSHLFSYDDETPGAFRGYVQFIKSGRYELVFRAEEDGYLSETRLQVNIVEA